MEVKPSFAIFHTGNVASACSHSQCPGAASKHICRLLGG